MFKGLIIICNTVFTIEQCLFSSLENLPCTGETNFLDLFDKEDFKIANVFVDKLKSEDVAFNFSLNIRVQNELVLLKFSGSKYSNNYLIFALETNSDVPYMYEELLRINNEQSNFIREILKDRFMSQYSNESENSALNDLSKLNNELANVQRELSKKNGELTKLNTIKNTFLGMAAHDLRNPLGNIYNFLELIEMEKDTLSERQLSHLSIVKTLTHRMIGLVVDLLDYSVIESGKIKLNIIKYNIIDLIENTISSNMHLAHNKSIHLSFSTPTKEFLIDLDLPKIEQVLINLITNAIKYSNERTIIDIELKDLGSKIQILVKDQGLGMLEEESKKLFQAFQKTSNLSTGGERSTGLGLYISKRIVQAHSGEIWVESTKNVGSEFYFTLPKTIN